jgi:hypothetical protein
MTGRIVCILNNKRHVLSAYEGFIAYIPDMVANISMFMLIKH